MADNRIAFGLCKKYNIKLAPNATPKEAWDALRDGLAAKGIDVDKILNDLSEDRDNRSKSDGSSKTPNNAKQSSHYSEDDFDNSTPEKFSKALSEAKKNVYPEDAWRVSSVTGEDLRQAHPGAKYHISKGGSTVCVTNDRNLIGLCRRNDDKTTCGKELVKLAVEYGADRLDSYSGNHGFYIKCGFEPVSWCEWDDQFAPHDWKEGRDKREPVIFYRYTGKKGTKQASAFMKEVKPSKDYNSARAFRDKEMEEDKKNGRK